MVRAYCQKVQGIAAGNAGGLNLSPPLLLEAWQLQKLKRLARQWPVGRAAMRQHTTHAKQRSATNSFAWLAASAFLKPCWVPTTAAPGPWPPSKEPRTKPRRAFWLLKRSCMDGWRADKELTEAVDPGNELEWRHARPGRPKWEWTELLCRCAGSDWITRDRPLLAQEQGGLRVLTVGAGARRF